MLRCDREKIYDALNKVLYSNSWGTISGHSVKAAEIIAQKVSPDGDYRAVLCDSTYAALETIVRGFFIGRGDKVIVPALSSPYIAQTLATVGCDILFADTDKEGCVISADWVEALADGSVKALICEDYCGYPCDMEKMRALLPDGARLILCTPDPFNTLYDGKPTVTYADASVAAFDEGCAVEADCAAVIMKKEYYDPLWSMHHCGNIPLGADMEALNAGSMPGGDMRICEWKSAVLIKELEAFFAIPLPDVNAYPFKEDISVIRKGTRSPFLSYYGVKHYAMNTQPVYKSSEYEKSSGVMNHSVCPFAQKKAKR